MYHDFLECQYGRKVAPRQRELAGICTVKKMGRLDASLSIRDANMFQFIAGALIVGAIHARERAGHPRSGPGSVGHTARRRVLQDESLLNWMGLPLVQCITSSNQRTKHGTSAGKTEPGPF